MHNELITRDLKLGLTLAAFLLVIAIIYARTHFTVFKFRHFF